MAEKTAKKKDNGVWDFVSDIGPYAVIGLGAIAHFTKMLPTPWIVGGVLLGGLGVAGVRSAQNAPATESDLPPQVSQGKTDGKSEPVVNKERSQDYALAEASQAVEGVNNIQPAVDTSRVDAQTLPANERETSPLAR